jgi:hypothetical protein
MLILIKLVDVVGLMTGISAEREYVRDGKVSKMIVLELTNDRWFYMYICNLVLVCDCSMLITFVLWIFVVVRSSVLCLVLMLITLKN